jgi:hypothetical protein
VSKILKLGSERKVEAPLPDSPLTPELKDFIDRAIVPALVRQYLAEMDAQNELAKVDEHVAKCDSSTATATLLGARE